MRLLFPILFVLSLVPTTAWADAAPKFGHDIRPVLDAYCYKCHGDAKAKGDVNLARFTDVPSIQREPKLWHDVLSQLNDRTMPPEGKPQPTEAQRAALIESIQYTLTHFEPGTIAPDPGRPALRRLNRFEYNNTVHDLFGIDSKPADAFPTDAAGGAGFDNVGDTLFVPPILMERYLAAADAVLKEARPNVLLVAKPGDGGINEREAARRIVERFATRAFRRPVADADLAPYLKLFDAARGRGDEFLDAVKLSLKGVLVSPLFLFRVEADHPDAKEAWQVNDLELATRLSYFLWCTCPDQTLFDLAKSGKLHEPAVLEQQVRRMLKDDRSKAIAESFGTQWLGIRDFAAGNGAQPDTTKFPKFTPSLRFAMVDEAVLFLDSVFRDDAPLTTLIDADYTFVNDWLAEHYGINSRVGGKDGNGEILRRVKLTDHNRGGILSLGAVLTTTSYPLRTSPVLRGKWVLEQVLGTPPPPPPPSVPELPKDDAAKGGLTFRQQLERHRQNAQCASCHAKMDPLGFGLENFDAVGRWRTEAGGTKVDASGTLPGGRTFTGPAELKQVLMSQKDQFVRNLTEKMLGYALGRGLEYYDQPVVQAICDDLARNEYKSSTLILDVVKSYPFRYRRNATTAN